MYTVYFCDFKHPIYILGVMGVGGAWHRRIPVCARTAKLTTGVGRRVVSFCRHN
jgi:hypothetical protein